MVRCPSTTQDTIDTNNRNGILLRTLRALRVLGAPRVLCAKSRSSSAPDFARGLDHQFQLPPLVVDGQWIAHEVAGEPTLRAQTQLLERQHSGRFIDAALEPVARLQRRGL